MTRSAVMRDELDLLGIERNLQSSLGTVEPDQQFIGNLRNRLVKKPDIEIEQGNYLAAYLVAGLGLFIGISLFWLLSHLFKGLRG